MRGSRGRRSEARRAGMVHGGSERASADSRDATPWSVLLKAHWRSWLAADFTSLEVWKLNGLVTYYVLLLIEPPTRAVRIAGITTNPAEAWMLQIARNLGDVEEGVL